MGSEVEMNEQRRGELTPFVIKTKTPELPTADAMATNPHPHRMIPTSSPPSHHGLLFVGLLMFLAAACLATLFFM